MESSIYNADIENNIYEGEATIIITNNPRLSKFIYKKEEDKYITLERVEVQKTLKSLLNKPYSDEDSEPKYLLDLLLKQEDEQLILLKHESDNTNFVNKIQDKKFGSIIKQTRDKFTKLHDNITTQIDKLMFFYNTQQKSLDRYNFFVKEQLDKLKTIIDSYKTIIDSYKTIINDIDNINSSKYPHKLGGKRKNTSHTIKKDKKLSIIYKKVKTMKYKQL